jgi:hypothetical protein
VIALYDPVTPMIQIGLALLGLIILVSLAFGWRIVRNPGDDWPPDHGDDLHELSDQVRTKRDRK